MEQVVMFKNSNKYGFKKGDTFKVMRNVIGDCVVINYTGLNFIMTEKRLRSYGTLTGKPEIGG